MCRHLGYIGHPVPLKDLLLEPPHALATQAWAPRDMRGGGTINADGFGVGWYPPASAPGEPVRYASALPIWSDPALPRLAAVTSAGAVLAAVRSATVGMPVTEPAAAPFVAGRWLFSHNGVVRGWPGAITGLASELPAEDLITLVAPTDSAILFALVRAKLRAGEPAPKAVASVISEVTAVAPGSRLNLLLTDGSQLVATTLGHSLSVRARAGSVLIASEPLDADASWQSIPDNRLVVATPGDVSISALL